jgi:hypothetical protein
MSATHYNPCTDGFPAKVWECLRRNEALKKQLEEITKIKDPDDRHWTGESYAHEAERIGNPLAAFILSSAKYWNTNICWNDLPRKKQANFASKFRKGKKISLSSQHFFTGEELAAYRPECINREKITAEDLQEINFLCEYYDFIAVPKKILHDKHRTEILDDIDAQIPKSLFRAITLKNDGRWLGTKSDWDIYNLYEGWMNLGFLHKVSQQLTAHEAKGHDFGISDNERRKCANGFLQKSGSGTLTHKDKRNSEARDAIKIIKNSITSVFPKFEPYCPPGKRNKTTLNSNRSD